MIQRLTLIIRLRRDSAAQDWRGQVEMVNPHRKAVFRNHCELWELLEDWTAQLTSGPPSAGEDKSDLARNS